MKQITGFFNYHITEGGDIWNSNKNSFLKPYRDKDGYLEVRLGAGNKRKIHRLVAMEFIPNPLIKSQVNHKNGIKSDNRVENLEWATPSENMQHSWDNGFNKISEQSRIKRAAAFQKPVLDLSTGIFYTSIKEASYFSGINYSTLKSSLNGNCKNKTKYILC